MTCRGAAALLQLESEVRTVSPSQSFAEHQPFWVRTRGCWKLRVCQVEPSPQGSEPVGTWAALALLGVPFSQLQSGGVGLSIGPRLWGALHLSRAMDPSGRLEDPGDPFSE